MTTLGLYQNCPAILDGASGRVLIVFAATAAGWSKAVRLALEVA